MMDYIAAAIIVLVLGTVSIYVRRARKRGRKCIGCPGGCACSAGKTGEACSACRSREN